MTVRPLSDAAARRTAATEFGRNLVVIAGAGTGKTSLVVERFLNLLLGREVPLESVTAITFTEKAAGEMRERVAAALDDVVLATAPGGAAPAAHGEAARSLGWLRGERGLADDALHARARAILDDLDGAGIGTIHGWCSDFLRRRALEADLPPEFGVDEGLAQEILFDEMWPEFLARELGPRAERGALWSEVLAAFLENEIEDAARSIALDPPACDLLAREGYVPLDARDAFGAEASELGRRLAGDRGEVSTRSAMPRFLDTATALLDAFSEGGPEGLRAVDPATLPFPEYADKMPTAGKGVPGKDEIEARAKAAQKLLKRLREIDEGVFPRLFEALRPFAAAFRRRVVHEGSLAYEDLLLLARNLLRDDPAVRRSEARRARAILVDEFQDTDPLQYEIVFLLAAREDAGTIDDPFAAPLDPGRLFIVGDPKQSIYRFRGADMAAFTRARERVSGGKGAEGLVTNFRSVPEILDPVNRLFGNWIGAGDPDRHVEPEYEAIASHRVPAGEFRTELRSVISPDGTLAGSRREAEAREVAREILELCRPASGGGYDFRDVAVLFRSLNDAVLYTRVMREAGIEFVVDGGKAFTERPEVVEALALLRALANPADPVATLAVLRSSLGGAADLELAAYAKAGGRWYWPSEPLPAAAGAAPVVAAGLARLRELDAATRYLPVDRRILAVLTESGFLLVQAGYQEGAQRTANVRKLAERAATLAREQGLTLEEAIRSLEDEFTGNRTIGESPLADEAVDAVRVLTMHKAKGLEYPVVILPDLCRGTHPNLAETRVRVFRGRGPDRLSAVVTGRVVRRNTAAVLAEVENARHEAAEEKRLLYVAATRARERLILVNSAVQSFNSWMKGIMEHWGYAVDKDHPEDPFSGCGTELAGGTVLHRVVTAGPPPVGEAARTPLDPAALAGAFRDAALLASGAVARRSRTPSADHRAETADSRAEDAAETPGARRRDLARAAGGAVHAVLEHWDFREPAAVPELVRRAAPGSAAEFGLDPADVLEAAGELLAGFVTSELPSRLAGAEILGRELPVLYLDDAGTVVHGYADLVYRLDGRVHVADYKTDAGDPRALAEHYRAQLADYAAAVRGALGLNEDPVAELILVRPGIRVETAT